MRGTKQADPLDDFRSKKKVTKRRKIFDSEIFYNEFCNELIAKGINIDTKYISALEKETNILRDALEIEDYDLIMRIIQCYVVKSVKSSTKCSVPEVTLSRFNKFKKNIHLFENHDLFSHGPIISYLSGADVNAIPYPRRSLLHLAVIRENKDIVKLLLENNANPNVKDVYKETIFFRAVKRNNYELAEYLIKAGARVDDPSAGISPLQWAISKINHEMADLIIKNGGDVNLVYRGKTPLYYAVDAENDDRIHLLIKNNADINATCVKPNEMALGIAINKHNINLIKTLISAGANVNLFSRYVTPLQFAIIKSYYNTLKIVKYLIKSGAKVNADSSPESIYFGQKALHIAIQKGNESVTRLLIKNNADIEAVTRSGQTALGIAVQSKKLRNYRLVEALIEAGVDINKFSAGIAPLNLAIAAKNDQIIDYFINHGADVNDVIADESNENLKSNYYGKKLIQQQIVRFRAADFKISDVNLLAVSGSEFYDLFAKCRDEVTLMKTINVGTTTLTYYDTLHTSIHGMAMRFKYVDNDAICGYKNVKQLRLYAELIHYRMEKTIVLKDFLNY
ncbi:hypothetical protein KQX54_004342 [Cotesia glomerata]|uniref:Ankyrin repeat protein n=1 Tax=Cotesia glomerata TaxID=32391 RepID=A0AAV7IXJ2_COTGL|nr:hypothetical protein KQX54_004342 [Cotesia glomerata]